MPNPDDGGIRKVSQAMANTSNGGKLALVVGGGPAPGINGVISSVTIEACNHGMEVIGFLSTLR